MQASVLQIAECGIKTRKFLQGEIRKTIIGELHNKVAGREIERTFKFQTDRNSLFIAEIIYDKLAETSRKEKFSLLQIGVICSNVLQTQYEFEETEKPLKRKVTVNLYGKEQAAVKIKSPTVRKHKKVKVKEEIKFFIPCINGKMPEKSIQAILDENISNPIKEGYSWEREKHQIFIEFNKNIFTIAVSQVHMLEDKEDFVESQRNGSLRRIEVEYQGTQWSALSENVQANESKNLEEQDIIELEEKVEKEISKQIRKISRRVVEICTSELCLPLITV